MIRKSPRDIEFAVRLAISALRREIDASSVPMQLGFDGSILYPERQTYRNIDPLGKHRRDLEKAISILKAIRAGVYESEG